MDPTPEIVKQYVEELVRVHQEGTELSHRAALSNLVNQINKDYSLISEPKSETQKLKIDMRGFTKRVKVGYVETKDIGINLDNVMESEQLDRYMRSVQNLVLTDYLEFRLIRDGNVVMNVRLAEKIPSSARSVKIDSREAKKLTELMDSFFQYKIPQITKAMELARYLADKARLLKLLSTDEVQAALKEKPSNPSVRDFVMLIKPLLSDAAPSEYVDAYSQTITFGILLAKSMTREKVLTKDNAANSVPQSVRIIRRILLNILDPELPKDISWIIDDIFDIVNASDLDKILSDIKEKTGARQEAFLLFYEYFLGNYDPEKRKSHGVYYTPRPVVSFIVNNVNRLLMNEFNKELGLGNDDVTIMDPSTGTGTFLAMSYLIALLTVRGRGYKGEIEDKIKNHLLKHFYGFELLVAPYVLSHLKLTTELEKTWGYSLSGDDRIQVYLTNTLKTTDIKNLYAFDEILQESKIASEIKDKEHILVILGNPPYSAVSQNKEGPIVESLKSGFTLPGGEKDSGYYHVDSQPLNEKNPKWLQDDYVKFIRFGQWKVEQNGEGILAFITNNGYLDNPTFRGMRQSLLSTFDTIYIVNLHGSSRKNEGSTIDENVFGIMQGVSIAFFIKHKNPVNKSVNYLDKFGKRSEKFNWLDNPNSSVFKIDWTKLQPQSPLYLFVPHNSDQEYLGYSSIRDLFPTSSVGIATARDRFTIAMTIETLEKRIEKFIEMDDEDARTYFKLGKDVRDWKVSFAKRDLIDSGKKTSNIIPFDYRPLDTRFTYYTGKSRGFLCMPRPEVMRNMLQDNVGLIITRGSRPEPWRDVFVSYKMTDIAFLSSNTSRSSYHIPLYIYKDGEKFPNINEETLKELSSKYNHEVGPEEIFSYVYGILSSKKYRDRYSDQLKMDFPRIPFPESYEKFQKVKDEGESLVDLHLMRTPVRGILNYPEGGDNKVRKISYENGKIHINERQYFDGVSQELWDFKIGSYNVLEKWLKGRLGSTLHSADIELFSRIAGIIDETIRLTVRIDAIVDFL